MTKVHLSVDKTRLVADFQYEPRLASAISQISGASFSKSTKNWRLPLDWDTCLELRKTFGNLLVLGDDVTAWAHQEKARRAQAEAAKAAEQVEFHHLDKAPALFGTLRNYQQLGVNFLTTVRRAILADEPGLGKTLQVLGAMVETDTRRALVVAPKTALESVWKREAEGWLGELVNVHVATGTRTQRLRVIWEYHTATGDGINLLVVNSEMLRIKKNGAEEYPELFSEKYQAVILDESDRYLSGRSRPNFSQVQRGLSKLRISDDGCRLAISGTPFRGKPQNIWGALNWIKPDQYGSYWRFVENYFDIGSNGFGREVRGFKSVESRKRFEENLSSLMLRRTKAEVLPDLPAKQYAGTEVNGVHGIWLPMTGKQAKHYEEMREWAETKLSGDEDELSAMGVLAEMTRLKQFASTSMQMVDGNPRPSEPSNKLDWLKEWLYERGGPGNCKVVVVSQFTSTLEMFGLTLEKEGYRVGYITGNVTGPKRAKAITDFQAGDTEVMLLNVKAGGVAITLDAADDMVFLDETFVPDDTQQAEDRIHRASRVHQCTYWFVRSEDTIEEAIARSSSERQELQTQILDVSRGVNVARKLIERKR